MHITPAATSRTGSPRESSSGGDVLSDHVPLCHESGLAFAPRMLHKSPIPDLVLGPILGKGGYGKVFRGLHKGQEVAVKVRRGAPLQQLSAAVCVHPFPVVGAPSAHLLAHA